MTYKQLEEKLKLVSTSIKEFEEKKLLFLKFLKSCEKQLNGVYDINFAVKIITNGKISPENYTKKINEINVVISKIENPQVTEADEKLVKKIIKLENMFERLISFMKYYQKIIETKKGQLGKSDILELQKLEQKEIATTLKKASELFISLKNEKKLDVIVGLAKQKGHLETNRVIPTLGLLFKTLFTDSKQKYNLNTPFGSAQVQLLKSEQFGIEFMIYCGGKAWSYNEICSNLDSLFLDNERIMVINIVIIPIIDYLKTSTIINIIKLQKYSGYEIKESSKKNKTIQKIFDMITFRTSNIKSLKSSKNIDDIMFAAISLSGILLLAEACQYRNPTFGKLERNAMKSVLRLAQQKECTNPFGKVFSNEKGRYAPAHSQDGNMDTQLLLSYNFENDSIKARFLPLPRGDEANSLIGKLLLLENNQIMMKIKNECYPHSWKDFFDDMEKGYLDNRTIGVVFTEFENLFPSQELMPLQEFINLTSVREKKKIVMKIKAYKPEDPTEKANVPKFVDFINREASVMNIKEKIEKMIAKNGILDIIQRLKKSGMENIMPVRIFDLCYCDSSEYIQLNTLPELSNNYLNSPANSSGLNLREYMKNKLDKLLKQLYKSQNQVLTKEQVKNLLS